jgi:peptidoglycan/LPS O-acetylase OafA/YrhL
LPGLDLLRAIAVLWTMQFHGFIVGGLGEDWHWLERYGWMGVDLFFVLSGYLIGGQLLRPLARGESPSLRDFYLKRAFRILPAFWVVLAIYLLWPGFREAPGMEPWWKFALFVVNLDIDYASNAAFSHAWSLCVEEHFYLLFPALALLLARKPSATKFWIACIVVLLGGIALRTGAWLHFDALQPQRAWFVEDIYYPTWNRLDGLLMGVMLATWQAYRPDSWARMAKHANVVRVARRGGARAGVLAVPRTHRAARQQHWLAGAVVGARAAGLRRRAATWIAGQARAARCRMDRGDLVQPLPGAQTDVWRGAVAAWRMAGRSRHRGVCGVRGGVAAGGGAAVLRGGETVPAPARTGVVARSRRPRRLSEA